MPSALTSQCFSGYTPSWKEDSVRFIAKAGEGNFLLIQPHQQCASIRSVTEEQVAKHLAGSKRVDLEIPGRIRN